MFKICRIFAPRVAPKSWGYSETSLDILRHTLAYEWLYSKVLRIVLDFMGRGNGGEDDRQYVREEGQQWVELEKHKNQHDTIWRKVEDNVYRLSITLI